VLSGGTTLSKGEIPSFIRWIDGVGFGQRVKNELERLAVKGTKIKIFAPPERKYTTWIGGSILAALGTFRKVFLPMKSHGLTSRCGSVRKNTRKTQKYSLPPKVRS